MSHEPPEILAFDPAALIDRLRRGDQAALAEAYQRTFDHEMGRFVLTHHLMEMGVGGPIGAGAELEYRAGRHDAALALAAMAKIDPAAIAVATLTGELTGDYDNAHRSDGDATRLVLDEDDLLG